MPRTNGVIVSRMKGWEIPGAAEYLRQYAGAVRGKVQYHKHRGRKRFRQSSHQSLQGFHSAYRTADYNYVAVCQSVYPFPLSSVFWDAGAEKGDVIPLQDLLFHLFLGEPGLGLCNPKT